MVGYHARNNVVDGVLAHTISSAQCRNLWFNDVLVGEVGVNGALCGHYGCPVLLVTGDVAVCREATDLFGAGLTTVAVKRGLSKYSASQIAPQRAREMIEEGAYQALQDLSAVAPLCAGIARDHYLRVWSLRHDDELQAPRGCGARSAGDEANQPR